MQPASLALTLPIRRLAEFLLRRGSIDARFTGFDRANEGARLHRKLQRAAVREFSRLRRRGRFAAAVRLRRRRFHAGRSGRRHLYRARRRCDAG